MIEFFKSLFKRREQRPKICPACEPGKTFPDNAVLQMCSKCNNEGLDFCMFYDKTKGNSFLVVFYTNSSS